MDLMTSRIGWYLVGEYGERNGPWSEDDILSLFDEYVTVVPYEVIIHNGKVVAEWRE